MGFLFFGRKKSKKGIEGINDIMKKEKILDRRYQKPVAMDDLLGEEMIIDRRLQKESNSEKGMGRIRKGTSANRRLANKKAKSKKVSPRKTKKNSKEVEPKNFPTNISENELKKIMKEEMVLNKKHQKFSDVILDKNLVEKNEEAENNLSISPPNKSLKNKKSFFRRIFGSSNKEQKSEKDLGEDARIEKEVQRLNKMVSNKNSVEGSSQKERKNVLPDKSYKRSKSLGSKKNLDKVSRKNVSEKISSGTDKGVSKESVSWRFKEGYVHTGIKGFDELFDKGHGVPEGVSALIEGGPGSGKTVFCLATLNNLCRQGKKCLYMSFEESEEDLIEHMSKFGWDAKDYIKKGLLRIKRFDAIDVSRSIEALLSAAKKELLIEVNPVFLPSDFEPDFLVIDSLTSIASAFSGQESRFRIYMEQLFRYLEQHKITNFLIREVSSPTHTGSIFQEQGEAVSFLSDGIIVLYNIIYDSGKRESALEILKMRGTSFKKKIVKMEIINNKGLFVYPDKILNKTSRSNFKLT